MRLPGLALTLALSAAAAAPPAATQPAFRAGVDLVTVPVVVTAKDGQQAGTLGLHDFRLWEDGVPQTVAAVNREPRPLSVCILLDSSSSMAGRETQATRAIDAVLRTLGDDDEVALLMFSAKVRVAFSWTRARNMRAFSWYGWRLSLGTSLLDAMKEALALVDTASNPLPVIVIVSDGGEMTSSMRLAALVSTRRQSEALVYAIRTERIRPKTSSGATQGLIADRLPEIVGDSGGRVYASNDAASGERAGAALVEELRSQYTLGFTPKRAFDGRYRRLRVEAVDPALAVRHRAGYLAHP